MYTTYISIGPAPTKNGQCTFTVWAPECNAVQVVLAASPQLPWPMEKGEMGYWTVTIGQVTPGMQYWYKLDNELQRPDPASRWQPEGVHGPSAIVDPSFDWTDNDWQGIEPAEMILYELHTGAFTQSGTFQGIISKLDHLQILGITAIELMPIAQFPGHHNWGYDGVFPFAIHNEYGTAADLKQLVNAAHQWGIAVILDVVYNHAGPEGNYLPNFAPYFTDKYKLFWGGAVNFDGAWCDGVRNYFIQNALMWLDEFRIDGLRLDAVHAIFDSSALHIMEELTSQVRLLEQRVQRRKLLIAEFDLNNPRYISPVAQGGYGMDAQWVDEFHHALHAAITGEQTGYYEDFGPLEDLARSLQNSYVYTGQFSKHRKRCFGKMPVNTGYNQFIAFVQNHDQVGNRLLGDRLSTVLDAEALKTAAATLMLSPHVPLLFMGEEYGEKNPFLYFTSHTDKVLIEQLCEGRRREFAVFNWEGKVPNPQEEAIFNQSKLSWQIDEVPGLLRFYKYLIAFRKEQPALQNFRRDDAVRNIRIQKNILHFERHGNAAALIICLNLGKEPESIQFEKACTKLFDTSDVAWNGPGSLAPAVVQPEQPFLINPFSALVFEIPTRVEE
ncbi:malto-oligosyltrehalose trehalohydrolase [Niastella yeongjuensis]|uniref:Malto-oligosyltrehalose trehalohydrolase n=1 Tax=Niastella yeongjuensis TaxID=354355 RepID=A0A1V9EJQ0_9BACT|nr:malto-oligosyltrehalose trehalohydrolase [Niastella yeongjuensis]OQP46291.1 malto-oligosyltrehalose trehalohydrolase [Niastella yeongjuensis]SEP46338.1 maltooligosyl trehalose hydrolase [Niastella yeongjuensis]